MGFSAAHRAALNSRKPQAKTKSKTSPQRAEPSGLYFEDLIYLSEPIKNPRDSTPHGFCLQLAATLNASP
jgi:hypothetical protein